MSLSFPHSSYFILAVAACGTRAPSEKRFCPSHPNQAPQQPDPQPKRPAKKYLYVSPLYLPFRPQPDAHGNPIPEPHAIVPVTFSSLSHFLPGINGQTDGPWSRYGMMTD